VATSFSLLQQLRLYSAAGVYGHCEYLSVTELN